MHRLHVAAGGTGALVLSAAFLLSGCTNSPNPPDWNQGKTLFQATAQEPISFDPTISYDEPDAHTMDPMFPCYYRYNYLKENPWGLDLNLGIIEPIREPITGTTHTDKGDETYHGERWTFEIRHDIRFQDDPCFTDTGGKGRNVTAKDFEYSFKRMANPKTEFPLFENLADKVLGWEAYSKAFSPTATKWVDPNYDKPLEGFKIDPNNPYRFSISFNQPYPQFRYLLAMHFTTPLPREAVEKYNTAFALKHPVGCGPFQMQEYVEHQRVVLVRNRNNNFWRFPTSGMPGISPELVAEEGKPAPLVDRIVMSIILEQVTSYNMFEQGYLDSWTIDARNARFMLGAVKPGKTMTERGVKMLAGAYPSITFCGFNMKDPTFGGYTPEKQKLRQAISLSLDSDAFIDLIDQGMASKCEFDLPRGLCGYDPSYKNPYRVYDPKLTRAKQLLAEAGYPGGVDPKTGEKLSISLDKTVETPIDSEITEFIAKEIEQLGLHVNIEAENYPTFSDKVNHAKIQFYYWGWVADYPDPENFLMLLYGPNGPNPNNTSYKNPEFDKLFEQMRSMDDGPAREGIIKRMRDISVEDCPLIYLGEDQAPTAFQPWVESQLANPILADYNNYRGVDADERVRLERSWNSPVIVPILILIGAMIVGVAPAVATIRRQRNRRVRRPADGGGDS